MAQSRGGAPLVTDEEFAAMDALMERVIEEDLDALIEESNREYEARISQLKARLEAEKRRAAMVEKLVEVGKVLQQRKSLRAQKEATLKINEEVKAVLPPNVLSDLKEKVDQKRNQLELKNFAPIEDRESLEKDFDSIVELLRSLETTHGEQLKSHRELYSCLKSIVESNSVIRVLEERDRAVREEVERLDNHLKSLMISLKRKESRTSIKKNEDL